MMRHAALLLLLLLVLLVPAGAVAQSVNILTLPTDPVGRNADTAVTPGAAGTMSGKLRQMSADIAAIKASLDLLDNIVTSNRAQVDVISSPLDPFGTNADAAATAGGTGSIQAKLRRLTADLAGVLAAVGALGDVNDAQVAAGAAGTLSAKIRRLSTDTDAIKTQLAGTLTMTCTNCSAGAGGASQSDRTSFADGGGGINPIAGYYSTSPTDPTSGQTAAVAITQKRGLKVTIYDSGGTEQAIGGGTQYDRDTVAGAADKLTMAGGVRRDTPSSLVGTDGDRTTAIFDASGRLHVMPALPTGASTLTEQQVQSATLGGAADALVAAGATGSISAKLRRLTTDLEAVRALLAAPQAVTGPLTDAQLRATAVPVNASGFTIPISAAALPNPTGAPTLASIQDVEAAIREAQGIGAGPSPFFITGAGATLAESVAVRCVNAANTAFESCAGAGGGGGGDASEATLLLLRTNVGTSTDAAATGNGTLIAINKQLRTLLNGGLPAALVGGRLDVNVGNSVTADTEMPAAVALGEGVANPTSPLVGAAGMLWNGGTWDRYKSAAHGLNSSGAGLPASQVICEFDDTSPTAITENQFGNIRCAANRAVYMMIRDGAGNERGANVNASGQLSVTVDAFPGLIGANISQYAGSTALTGGVAGSLGVGGLSASGATQTGNPVKVGGVFNTTQPTVTNNQAVDAQYSARGAAFVVPGVEAFTVQPGNTPNTTAWLMNNVGGTAGGATGYSTISTAAVLSAVVKASAGQVYSIQCFNLNAAPRYVRLYNQTGAPGSGDTANITWRGMCPGNTAGTGFTIALPIGLVHSAGVGIRASTGIADNDTGALAANELIFDVQYK